MSRYIVFVVSVIALFLACFLAIEAAPIAEEEEPPPRICGEKEPCVISEYNPETIWPPGNSSFTSCQCGPQPRIYCITNLDDLVDGKYVGLCRKLPDEIAPIKNTDLGEADDKIPRDHIDNIENFNLIVR